MSESATESLLLDLLEWLAVRERTYQEVMNAWRTSCPRLPVWEEANDRGLVIRVENSGREIVKPSFAGLAFVGQHRRKTVVPSA